MQTRHREERELQTGSRSKHRQHTDAHGGFNSASHSEYQQ